jgi:hypothetical protein
MAGGKVFPVAIEISPCHVCQASCPWCCVAGTMIETPNGLRPIETITIGDYVYGPSGKPNRVTSSGSRLVERTFEIRTGSQRIRVTGEHPFLAEQGFRPAETLEVGQKTYVRVRMRKLDEALSRNLEQVFSEPPCPMEADVIKAKTSDLIKNEASQSNEKERYKGEGFEDVERQETFRLAHSEACSNQSEILSRDSPQNER